MLTNTIFRCIRQSLIVNHYNVQRLYIIDCITLSIIHTYLKIWEEKFMQSTEEKKTAGSMATKYTTSITERTVRPIV